MTAPARASWDGERSGPPPATILLVDDDRALLRALQIGLKARGYTVEVARNGEEGATQAALVTPDVVVLDLGLPDTDGMDVCRRIRQWSVAPIIVLSAVAVEERKVSALDAGADDYITKPFGMAELEARLRVALRHAARANAESQDTELTVGGLHIDLVHRSATLEGRDLGLTRRELDLLSYLARHAGKLCTHQMILRAVWGDGYGEEAHYLREYIRRLRRKMGPAGSMIETQPGIGYRLNGDGPGPR